MIAQQQGSPSGAQIREQVREQGAAAREQAREAAREAHQEAAQAREAARAAVAQSQGGGPVIVVPPRSSRGTGGGSSDMPPGAVDLGIAFFVMVAVIVIGLGLLRVLGRRFEGRPQPAAISSEMAAQLQRIEHAVESMAIEVERISEAQRFMARLQSERSPAVAAIGERSSVG